MFCHQEPDTSLYKPSLESMRTLIRASTTSMTSVPKPLKFMRPHYTTMKHIHEKIADPAIQVTTSLQCLSNPFHLQKECANLISVLAMTSDEPIDCIIYRLKGTQVVVHLFAQLEASLVRNPLETGAMST